MTPDEPPKDPEHEAVVGEVAGGEESAGAAGGDAGVDGVEGVAAADSTADGRAEGASADGPPTEVSVSSGEAALASPAAGGRPGGRRRPWRTAAIGLGSAVGVAGIAVLSVFIYSIFDDDSGGWSTYEYSIVDDDSGGWFGYAPGRLDEDRRLDRDDERGDGRDRPVEVGRHGGGAGRAGDNGRPGSSAGHPDGTGGDKSDGYEDAAAAAASKGCVEVKNLGRQVLLLCDRAPAGSKGVEGRWKDYGERPGPDALDAAGSVRGAPDRGRGGVGPAGGRPRTARPTRGSSPARISSGLRRWIAGRFRRGDVARRRRRIRDRVRHTVRGVREVLHRSSSPS